jgi:8-hydroxy-5-deazaflavin:NADPH oxidoreductase
MTTAIIGVGNIGSALAEDLVAGGERVVLAAREQAHAEALAKKLGEGATAATVPDAISQGDVIVFAVAPPLEQSGNLADEHADLLADKVVVDPSNPLVEEVPDGYGSAAQYIAGLLPSPERLVKAFGTLDAASLADGARRDPRAVLFYAADDDEAGKAVVHLITAAGFEPLKAGGLEAASRLEVPGGDLHQHGGLEGRLLDIEEARAAL